MDSLSIDKAEALAAYGGNQAELARALGLSRQAVSAMPNGPLLERHALKLRFVLKPELFGAANDDAKPDPVPSEAGQGAPNSVGDPVSPSRAIRAESAGEGR